MGVVIDRSVASSLVVVEGWRVGVVGMGSVEQRWSERICCFKSEGDVF